MTHYKARIVWTQDLDETIMRMRKEGKTFGQIAKFLRESGVEASRCSIVARAHRLIANGGASPDLRLWTPERDELLKSMRARGLSFAECAEAVTATGFPISAHSAISRASRLGIPSLPRSVTSRPPKPKKTKRAEQEAERVDAYVSREGAWLPLPESRRIQIIEIREGLCKWPLWDGPTIGEFCGADSGDHRCCPGHRRLGMSQQPLKPIHAPRETKRAVREKVEDLMRVMA